MLEVITTSGLGRVKDVPELLEPHLFIKCVLKNKTKIKLTKCLSDLSCSTTEIIALNELNTAPYVELSRLAIERKALATCSID